jgi:hypothetical protein
VSSAAWKRRKQFVVLNDERLRKRLNKSRGVYGKGRR